MPRLERHLFICENRRPEDDPRGCCAAKGSPAIRARFKKAIAALGLKGRVRANSAGCLDQCEYGVSVVVYPEGVWYGGVREEDVDEIVRSHLVEGRPVERLLMRHLME